eukprot:551505-Hanusia_phi.AAC.1
MTRTVSASTEALNRERETAIPSCGPAAARLGGRRDRDRHMNAGLHCSAAQQSTGRTPLAPYGSGRPGPPPE